jgi:hypothetical protein
MHQTVVREIVREELGRELEPILHVLKLLQEGYEALLGLYDKLEKRVEAMEEGDAERA